MSRLVPLVTVTAVLLLPVAPAVAFNCPVLIKQAEDMIKKAETKVTPDTRFRIGTASIVLTSAAAGLLLEKGKLKLDDEIQAYVPSFPGKPWPVTVRTGLVNR